MSTDISSAYQTELQNQKFRQSRIGCVLGLVLLPFGTFLDYFVYPESVFQLLIIRLTCSLAIGLTLLLHRVEFGKKYAFILPFTWPMLINIATCSMIYLTEGAISPYYAGLNIVIIGIIFILPLSIKESLVFCLITIAMYLLTCIFFGNIAGNFNIFYNNINFLALTGAVSCLVSHVNSRNNFHQFRLSYELEAKNKQLTNLEKLRTNFFANISHELRTPLTLILSPVQDLLQSDASLNPRVKKILQTTHVNALRLLKLVNDLLEVIRIEEGKSQLNLQPLTVDPFLADLVDSITYLSGKKHIRIEKSLSCTSAQILGDMYAFEKIIMNLLHNAIKFSSENGLISLSSTHDSRRLKITISDNGIGIIPEELPYIFDRFRQADSSSTRQHQGSGLGLSLVKDLTEQFNGEIGVRSQPGSGSTFTLSFPLHLNSAPGLPLTHAMIESQDSLHKLFRLANRSGMLHLDQTSSTPKEPLIPPLSSHSVLVVEDEQDLREYLVTALVDNYTILEAADGEKAWQMIVEQKPSLIVLDLMLPKLDGLDLCARIKQNPELRTTKIILLTARIDEEAKITALNNGADDFLTKPFSTLELLTRIRNLLTTTDFEKELINANTTLKQTLTELKETQTQLIQSEKTNALEYLSAGILHEINNPLNYTLTALQLARNIPEANESEMLTEILEDMNEGMCRIKDIVTDLQTFAHPSSVEKQTAFKLASAIKTALNFTSQDANSVKFTDNSNKEARVIGSKNHIVQVLINLITNALKAIRTVEGIRKGEILISSSVKDNRLTLSIRDNGTGIAQEILEKIFDPFFTTRDVGEGMGLGLSVSQTIIKSHNGKLRAQSVAGEWTEFSFDLELSQSN